MRILKACISPHHYPTYMRDAGQPELRDGMAEYLETPEYFSQRVEEFINRGVSIIGVCCGTTPDHVQCRQ